jgi:hypothetical protein
MKSAAFGFRILPRNEFMAIDRLEGLVGCPNLTEDEILEHDRRSAAQLKERAAKYEGAFVLYDPEDDGDGFLLVGNDPEELDRVCYERELEIRGEPRLT